MNDFYGVAKRGKYCREIAIHNSLYCASDCHYYVLVTERSNDKWMSLSYKETSNYVYETIKQLLRENIENVRVFERAQGGERRYDDYRYHTVENLHKTIELQVATGGNPVTSGQAAYAHAAALETIGNRFKER